MKIHNRTAYSVSPALREAVIGFAVDGLMVEIKYCPLGTRRYASGTYYRKTTGFENGRLIRVRINRENRYPVEVTFATSEYYRRVDARGREVVYQKLRRASISRPEDLILSIFLHEFSHYLDHIEGRNGRYKQTKADRFAVENLERLGVLPGR